jgi:sugar/nucleoside kinase (ribokinase family)
MALMIYDVIVLGDYFFDQIFWGLPDYPTLGRETFAEGLVTTGGAMFITAVALSRLGVRVGWPATFGNDDYSSVVYHLAHDEGVDLALARRVEHSYARVTSAIPFAGERAFLTYMDPEPDDLIDYWQQQIENSTYRHVHFGGMVDRAHFERIAAIAREAGATVSSDCQDGAHLEQPCACRDLLAALDVFLPNAREARIVAEVDDTEEAVRVLMNHIKLVVVKDGEKGAWIGQNGKVTLVPGIQASQVVDTTGAGDCFNAGFLYGYILEKADTLQCVRYGNICGGLSVTGVGGATHAPSREELLHHASP